MALSYDIVGEAGFYYKILSEEIMADIGYVSAEWGFLENVVEDAIGGMLGAHPTMMYAVTANVQMGARIKIMRSLADFRLILHPSYEQFKKLLDRIEHELGPWRNAVVHGFWSRSESGDSLEARVFSSRANKRIQFRSEHMNRYYLRWLGTEIGTAAIELGSLLREMGILEKSQNNTAGQ